VNGKRVLTSRGAKKLAERERQVGLEEEDAAARWLAEHDPPPEPTLPKAARKSKTLHQWRRRRDGH
jgi:hypothetical protein